MSFFFLISILIFSFSFRSFFRYFFKDHVNFDAYYHLILIKFIRKNGIRNLIEKKRFIENFNLEYPWLLHYIISYFPKKYNLLKIEKYTNPFLDTLFVFFLYIITFNLTKSNNLALSLCVLYLFTPASFTTLINGPRITSFTPRLFGEIVGSLMFISEYLYFIDGSQIYFILAIIFAGLTILSSKFSFQAIFFISIFLFIFTLKAEYLVILFCGLVFSILISGGEYLKVIKRQLDHLKWHFVKNLQGKIGSSNRNSLKILKANLKSKNIKKFFVLLFFKNTFIIVATRFPISFFSLYLIFVNYKLSNNFELIDYFILSSFSVFFLSSLKWFLFIGEAERYLNYVFFFIILKVLLFFSENSLYINILIFYGVLFFICEFYLTKKRKLNDNDEIISWLNKQKRKLKIATIPYHLGGWKIVYETKHHWLYHLSWEKNKIQFLENNFLIEYPILDVTKAKRIIEKYDLDYIFFDKKILSNYYGKNFPSITGLKTIKISKNVFALFKYN